MVGSSYKGWLLCYYPNQIEAHPCLVSFLLGEGVLVYHNNDRCEAFFENGSLVEPTRFIKQDQHTRRHSKTSLAGGGGGASASSSSKKQPKTTCLLYHDDPDGFIQYLGPVTSQNKRHGECRNGMVYE